MNKLKTVHSYNKYSFARKHRSFYYFVCLRLINPFQQLSGSFTEGAFDSETAQWALFISK